jgi:hypothetical protein
MEFKDLLAFRGFKHRRLVLSLDFRDLKETREIWRILGFRVLWVLLVFKAVKVVKVTKGASSLLGFKEIWVHRVSVVFREYLENRAQRASKVFMGDRASKVF